MSFGAILAVVIDDMHDVERLESHLVKDNRSIEILDGYEDMVEQEFTSFVSRFVLHKSSQGIAELPQSKYPYPYCGTMCGQFLRNCHASALMNDCELSGPSRDASGSHSLKMFQRFQTMRHLLDSGSDLGIRAASGH